MQKARLDAIMAINGTPDELFLRTETNILTGETQQLAFAWYEPIYTRTLANCVYGDPIGCIDRVLLNRLETNVDFLDRLFEEAYIARQQVQSVDTVWDRTMYLYAADLERIRSNIAAVRSAGYVETTTPDPPLIPADTFPNYDQINEWEKCLLDIRVLFKGSQENLLRKLGTFTLGTNYLLQVHRRR